jgi:hypothetical protein
VNKYSALNTSGIKENNCRYCTHMCKISSVHAGAFGQKSFQPKGSSGYASCSEKFHSHVLRSDKNHSDIEYFSFRPSSFELSQFRSHVFSRRFFIRKSQLCISSICAESRMHYLSKTSFFFSIQKDK